MTIDAKKLNAAVARVVHLAAKRTTLPILNHLHLSVARGVLSVQASDLTAYAAANVECVGEMEAVCVPASKLQMLANAAVGEVSIDVKPGGVRFSCDGIDCTLFSLKADEFPPFPAEKSANIGVNCEDLAEAIRRVSWACSTDEIRYTINGAWLDMTGKSLIALATNEKIAARCELPSITPVSHANILGIYASEFCDVLAEEGAVFSIGENYVSARSEFGVMHVKQIEGRKPTFDSIFTGSAREAILMGNLEREQFGDALGLVRGLSFNGQATFSPVVIKFEAKRVLLDAPNFTRSIPGEFKEATTKVDANRAVRIFSKLRGDVVQASVFQCGAGNGLRLVDGDTVVILAGLS